jgi:plasmid stabilization system protein ParE
VSLLVIFRSSALIDINEAYRWYEQQRPGLGASFMAELGEAEALIGDNPELFRKVRREVRRAMLHKFRYGVFLYCPAGILQRYCCHASRPGPEALARPSIKLRTGLRTGSGSLSRPDAPERKTFV